MTQKLIKKTKTKNFDITKVCKQYTPMQLLIKYRSHAISEINARKECMKSLANFKK